MERAARGLKSFPGWVQSQCPLHLLHEEGGGGIFVFLLVVQEEQEDAPLFLVDGVIDPPRCRRTELVATVLAPCFEDREREFFQPRHMIAHLLWRFGEAAFQPLQILRQLFVTVLHIASDERRECRRFDDGERTRHDLCDYASAAR